MKGGGSSFGQQGSGGAINSHHGSCGSAFSGEGSGGSLEQHENRAQHHPWIAGYENPPVIVYHHHESSRRSSRKSICLGWSFTASIGALIGSLWMLFGLYGSEHLEMGLNYSRIVRANKLFVQSISVKNRELAPGPRLYGFHSPPNLDDEKEWSVDHDVTIPGFYHKEWAFWLNRKSKMKLEYKVASPSNLFLVIAQGKNNYNEWIQDTGNPDWCLLWKPVHGHGHITFEATKDDEYYIGIANLYQTSIELELNMEIRAKVYETEEADFWCPLDVRSCTIALPLKGSEVGVITTPDESQEGVDLWHVTVSYDTRWSTYIAIYGVLGLLLLSNCCCRLRSKRRRDFYQEVAPLNSETAATCFRTNPTIGSLCPHNEMQTNSTEADMTALEISDENLCTICFEDRKNCFFQPCGHCATCYNCGLRVKEASAACPICRQPIQDVRKIYIT
ncbi:E3 ubiquitin-protein ligase APD2 [Cryptomeria japonica]|uniref:E3 ubiquitin-protein ligase APD2 n=1 Tax=Cryptomeria japonica TaxID=3369 RepID=UPI0025ABE85E|nr:E3 ubiquitin-protein ligase APD2 [Cryptomeria japonica]